MPGPDRRCHRRLFENMFGVLNINKPSGPTSRDVVDRVQRLVRPHKAGHAGTLDPLASGVLLVCVGQATRLVEYAQQLPKSYRGTFLLGRRSETDDVEHAVEVVEGAREPSGDEIAAALPRFTGEISQRPPRHSAVKIDGRRAYQLARRGVEFEPEAKTVRIDRLEVERYTYPELVLRVECGSGTYIRSLGRDLAEALGTTAVMSALERTAVGGFRVEDAIEPERLDADWQRHLLDGGLLTAAMPALTVDAAQLGELQHGRLIAAPPDAPSGEIAAYERGSLVAILIERRPGLLGAVRNFTQAE
jgi:tRNA pseudouridine55 synthase